jgi:hypothetical protein
MAAAAAATAAAAAAAAATYNVVTMANVIIMLKSKFLSAIMASPATHAIASNPR